LRDVPTPCDTGNCKDEIVTTFFINLDPDCDGTPDLVSPSGHVCFFAEARTPTSSEGTGILWSGPLQGRISTVGGEKTVSFAFDPLAVTLSSFFARARLNRVVVRWQTASEIDNIGFNLYRAESADGPRVQLNQGLIPSLSPGSATGADYRFVDRNVEVGHTYFYWLEDVDIHGVATLHGPVKVVFGLQQTIEPQPLRLPLAPSR
jgi:hypothetical protein